LAALHHYSVLLITTRQKGVTPIVAIVCLVHDKQLFILNRWLECLHLKKYNELASSELEDEIIWL